MRRRIFVIVVGVVLSVAAPAVADCTLNGKPVPEGTRDGGFVCQNGQWVQG